MLLLLLLLVMVMVMVLVLALALVCGGGLAQHLPFEGITLVHLDAHPDLLSPGPCMYHGE